MGLKGFVPMKKGTPLYIKTKEIYAKPILRRVFSDALSERK